MSWTDPYFPRHLDDNEILLLIAELSFATVLLKREQDFRRSTTDTGGRGEWNLEDSEMKKVYRLVAAARNQGEKPDCGKLDNSRWLREFRAATEAPRYRFLWLVQFLFSPGSVLFLIQNSWIDFTRRSELDWADLFRALWPHRQTLSREDFDTEAGRRGLVKPSPHGLDPWLAQKWNDISNTLETVLQDARELLQLIVFMGGAIPERLLTGASECPYWESNGESCVYRPRLIPALLVSAALDTHLRELVQTGLITRSNDRMIFVDPLTMAYIQDRTPDRRWWENLATNAVLHGFPKDKYAEPV